MTKSELGQFYTTNYNYILQSFIIPIDIVDIIEPFAGNGDLLKYIDSINITNVKYNDLKMYSIISNIFITKFNLNFN